jgi:hypothetical protein
MALPITDAGVVRMADPAVQTPPSASAGLDVLARAVAKSVDLG